MFAGTDIAAAHVAAVAALIMSYTPTLTDKFGRGKFTTPAQIREALITTARQYGDTRNGTRYEKGMVQAKAALEYLDRRGQACTGSDLECALFWQG